MYWCIVAKIANDDFSLQTFVMRINIRLLRTSCTLWIRMIKNVNQPIWMSKMFTYTFILSTSDCLWNNWIVTEIFLHGCALSQMDFKLFFVAHPWNSMRFPESSAEILCKYETDLKFDILTLNRWLSYVSIIGRMHSFILLLGLWFKELTASMILYANILSEENIFVFV